MPPPSAHVLTLGFFSGAWSWLDRSLKVFPAPQELVLVCPPEFADALRFRVRRYGLEAQQVVGLVPLTAGGWGLALEDLPPSQFLSWLNLGDVRERDWLAAAGEWLATGVGSVVYGEMSGTLHKAQVGGEWTALGPLLGPELPRPWISAGDLWELPPGLSGLVGERRALLEDAGCAWLLAHPALWELLPWAWAQRGPLPTLQMLAGDGFFADLLPTRSPLVRERSLRAAAARLHQRPEWQQLCATGWPDSWRGLPGSAGSLGGALLSSTKTLLERAQVRTPKAAPPPPPRDRKWWSRPPPALAKPVRGKWPRLGAVKALTLPAAELTEFLAGAEQLTVDVFDTCLHRAIGHSSAGFLLVAHHLQQRGIPVASALAFREARLASASGHDVHWDAIYRALQELLGWSAAQAQAAQEIELAVEASLLYANPLMLRSLRSRTAPFHYVSDMYLPAAVLREWLGKHDFPVPGLTVSSEAGVSKAEGRLLPQVLQNQGWAAATTRHVGDNSLADVIQPQAAGMDALRFRDQPGEAPFFDEVVTPCDWQDDLLCALTVGLARKHRKQHVASFPGALGYELAGPLLFGYALWLRQQVRQQGLQTLYFLARDGYWLQQLFTLMDAQWGPCCTHHYVGISRESVLLAMRHESQETWAQECLSAEPNLTSGIVLRRAGLAKVLAAQRAVTDAFGAVDFTLVDATGKWLAPTSRARLLAILQAHWPAAQGAQEEARTALAEYLTQHGYTAARAAFVDVGWTGSVPRYLSRALVQEPPLRMCFFGSYLGPAHARRAGVELHAWYFTSGGIPVTTGDEIMPTRAQLLYPVRHFIELFISGTEGKSIGFARDAAGRVQPVLAAPPADVQKFIAPLQDQAMAFCRELLGHLPQEAWTADQRLEKYLDSVLYRVFWIPRAEEVKVLGALPIEGSAFSNLPPFRSVVLPEKNAPLRSSATLVDSCQRSVWQRGWLAQLAEEELAEVASLSDLLGKRAPEVPVPSDLWT